MPTLPKDEMETHLNMAGDDRDTWHVFSDDPVMQRKFESVGATLTRTAKDGHGKWYTLPTSQVSIRIGRKQLSDERKVELGDHMRRVRKLQEIT